MYHIQCNEVWGGIRNTDAEVCTNGLAASLFSSACQGGKGGDIYYVGVCSGDLLTRIALADVMGHGETVSRVSQWVYDSLVACMDCLDNDAVLADLNRQANAWGANVLATAALLAFFKVDSTLSFAYAGHPPALVWRYSEPAWKSAPALDGAALANMALGVSPDAVYSQQAMPLTPGDRLFLYTDGVVEAFDTEENQFGQHRLLDVLHEHAEKSLPELKNAVLAALRLHTGGPFRHDDVTFLAAEVL